MTALIIPPKQAGLAEEVWLAFTKEEGQQGGGAPAEGLLLHSSSEDPRELLCWGGPGESRDGSRREEKVRGESGERARKRWCCRLKYIELRQDEGTSSPGSAGT